MTAAEMIAELQKLAPETHILAADGFAYRPAALVRIAGTEYCVEPVGAKKAAIVGRR